MSATLILEHRSETSLSIQLKNRYTISFRSAHLRRMVEVLNGLLWVWIGTHGSSKPHFLTTTFLNSCIRTPCGFCFVEYYTHAEATAAVRYISGTKLDERIVRCDLDLGYREGRQYGRGKSGGQVYSQAYRWPVLKNTVCLC